MKYWEDSRFEMNFEEMGGGGIGEFLEVLP
jgi:hypothetical protein